MLLASISGMLQMQPDFKALERRIWEATAEVVRGELRQALEWLDGELMARRLK